MMMNIHPVSKYRQPMQMPKLKVTRTMLFMLLLFGMAIGYILGLCQQVAQRHNRETLQICRGWKE